MSFIHESQTFARFARGLPAFLRQRITLEKAQHVVQRRVAERADNFLAMLDRGVFGNPQSPYLRMLELAGCERGEVQNLIARSGVEAALRALHDAGVYVTFEEFKGRTPIVRQGVEIPLGSHDFDNPSFKRYYQLSTGGSTGKGRRVLMDLEHMQDRLPMQ